MFLHVKNGTIIKHYGDDPPILPDDGRIEIPDKEIWLGQLAHPVNVWGARVTFEPEPTDETHATARMFVVQIPGETIRKFYPEHDTDGFGYRFIEGDFFKPRLFEETVRIFPLATQTLHLKIEEPMDYDTALALLKAIETGTWKSKQPRSTTRKTRTAASSPHSREVGAEASNPVTF